ncbi:MAG: hypothetical protein GY953_49155 [bacterium]|nr:hypothetical protein [bacterium]
MADPVVAGAEALSEDLEAAGRNNGRLPAEILVEIESSSGCLLEHEAAEHWIALEEHAAADGIDLVARWCYRNLSTQRRTYDRNCPLTPLVPAEPGQDGAGDDSEAAPVRLVRKCRVATAKPGNSNHGWGRAIDVKQGGRLLSCQSPSFQWLLENAHLYGWVHPDWAGCGEPKEEPWHWEWAGAPPADEPLQALPPATVKKLALWLYEYEWSQHVSSPADFAEPNWVTALLRGADAT